MLDNRYALLFIRGERPILDEKIDILSHPNVALTTDGKGKPYCHGGVTKAVAGISLPDSLEGEIQAEDVGEVDVQALELFSNEELETVFSQNKEEETDDV